MSTECEGEALNFTAEHISRQPVVPGMPGDVYATTVVCIIIEYLFCFISNYLDHNVICKKRERDSDSGRTREIKIKVNTKNEKKKKF